MSQRQGTTAHLETDVGPMDCFTVTMPIHQVGTAEDGKALPDAQLVFRARSSEKVGTWIESAHFRITERAEKAKRPFETRVFDDGSVLADFEPETHQLVAVEVLAYSEPKALPDLMAEMKEPREHVLANAVVCLMQTWKILESAWSIAHSTHVRKEPAKKGSKRVTRSAKSASRAASNRIIDSSWSHGGGIAACGRAL